MNNLFSNITSQEKASMGLQEFFAMKKIKNKQKIFFICSKILHRHVRNWNEILEHECIIIKKSSNFNKHCLYFDDLLANPPENPYKKG